jgi:hypothetical protein
MARQPSHSSLFLRGVLRGALGVALLSLGLFLPAAARAAEPGVVPDLTWASSSAEQDRTATAISDVHAKWVRLNANWADAEPTKGSYNTWWLAQYDRAVDLARSAGAKIVMLSYQSPSWASGSSNVETPPKDPADYARFMSFLAKRYAGKVQAYEVWNEENISRFWSTGPDPAAYTRLLKASYGAIKSADPNAKVVFGGLSTNDYRFVEGAYAAGAKGNFDVMSVHPYTCGSPENVWRDGSGRIARDSFAGYREVRASMAANGEAKPIWFTEFGWSTTSQACGVSENTQADYLNKALRFVEQDPYVEVALWYNFRNNYWNHDSDELEARYGLLRTDFSPKPAYAALKNYTPGSATTAPTGSTATKRHRTSTVVSVKKASVSAASLRSHARSRRHGQKMVVGMVKGATSGRVILRLQRYSRGKHRWGRAIVKRTTVAGNGSFSKSLRKPSFRHGHWRVQAVYSGAVDCEGSRSGHRKFRL